MTAPSHSSEPIEVGLARSRRGKKPDASQLQPFFDDCEMLDKPEHQPRLAPEKRVRVQVLHPFLVSHDGTAYWPEEIPEVPESIAADWVRQKWVTEA